MLPHSRVSKGVTLLELLIAISIFVSLAALLAGLLSSSLDLWKMGESQGDLYDRLQILFEQVRCDLESVYVEKENSLIIGGDSVDYVSKEEPSFYADIAPNRHHWFYLIRVGRDGLYGLVGSEVVTKKLERVLYYVKPNASGQNALWRVVLSKNEALNFWRNKRYLNLGGFQGGTGKMVFDNILYFGLRCRVVANETEPRWDSLKPVQAGFFNMMTGPAYAGNITIPEQFLPQAVEIEVVLAPGIFTAPKILLNEDIKPGLVTLKTTSTRGLPAPPDYLKIGDEWMSYQKIGFNTVTIKCRGERNTRVTAHALDDKITYGETIRRVYYLPTCQASLSR